jgi:hypothetical protein
MLLTEPDYLVDEAKNYLNKHRHELRNIYILGDDNALSEEVRAEVVSKR